jgi:hypothetical protein
MTDWDSDLDSDDANAWKDSSEDKKPWEDADAWKLEEGYKPGETEAKRNPKIKKFLEVTIGFRPAVPTTEIENAPDITVKDRDALKLVSTLSAGQKATTEEGELFQFSIDRYMWVKIPWEIC